MTQSLDTIGLTPDRSARLTADLDPRANWWPYLLVALAAGIYLFLFVRVQWRIGDEGDMINGALAVTEGRVPYRDFFDIRGPASFYWLGLFFKVFGASWAVARAHLLLTGILTSVLVYHLTRRVYGGIESIVPAFLVTVLSIPNWPAPHHHWDSNLFALGAVAVFFAGQRERRLRWLFVSGMLAGLTSCFMYQKGFLLVVSFVLGMAVVRVWSSAKLPLIRGAIAILAGYCAVGVCVLAWFHHIGGLSSLVDSTIRFPLGTYIEANKTPYGYLLTMLTGEPGQLLRTTSSPIVQLLALFLMLPVLLIAALPFLIGPLLLLRLFAHSRTPVTADEVSLLTIGVALWFSEFHRRDIMHLIYGAPVLLIAAGLLWSRASGIALQKFVAIPLLTTIVVMGAGQGIWASLQGNERFHTRRGNILLPADDPALRFLLSDKVAAGDYVFVYPYYATYYFLADVRNPTRFGQMMYGPGLKPYFDEAIAAIEARGVKYILWDTVWEGENLKAGAPEYQLPPESERWMDVYIRNHYRQVDVLNGFRVMQRIEPSL